MNDRAFVVSRIDIWLPAAFGIVGLGILIAVAAKTPSPTQFQAHIFLVLLALSAAAFAALIPGLLHVDISAPGIAIRAAGALGVFCLVFFYEPANRSIANGLDLNITPTEVPVAPNRSETAPLHGSFSVSNGDRFVALNDGWREEPPYDGTHYFTFTETGKSSTELLLYDKSRNMELRLPMPGGVSQWRYRGTATWSDWLPVTFTQ